jgi:hypothetical protein
VGKTGISNFKKTVSLEHLPIDFDDLMGIIINARLIGA